MKRKALLSFLAVATVLTVLAATLLLSTPRGTRPAPGQEGTCAQYGITFDDNSVETLYLATDTVLAAPEAFRETDPAYRILATAYQSDDAASRLNKWVRNLHKIDRLTPERRAQQEPLLLARELMADREALCAAIVPHVLSYLPDGTDPSTTVYLTALDHPSSGQSHNKYLVLALSHPLYHQSELLFDQGGSTASNILAHELFHRGYNENWFLRTEHGLENGRLQDLINGLQNEGMATYVAYRLRSMYPSSRDPVYLRLQSELWVRVLIARLNRLFERADSMDPDELWRKVVQFTHRQQSAYVVGAYMAKTIEEQMGREALAATVAEGPISFIHTYNSVAKEGMRLAFQPTPPDDSVYLRLREAALAGDGVTFEALLSTIEETTVEPSYYEAYTLYTTGHLLRQQGDVDRAIRVFQLHAAFSPENANGYLGLGECYLAVGEDDLARAAFEQGLRLDPRAVWAAIALEELE